MSTYVFYHIFCNQLTIFTLREQLAKIIYSGLYKKVTRIYCSITGDPPFVNQCIGFIQTAGEKFHIMQACYNDPTCERFTILAIKNFIKPEDKFLYMHTKGVTKPFEEPVYAWRALIEYQLIANYNQCLELLDSYDTVGVNYRLQPSPHYSGNYWWTTGAYFLKLPPTIGDGYTDPEMYILSANPRYHCIYDSEVSNHYEDGYPFNKYIDT
jgi:hypothetical protein